MPSLQAIGVDMLAGHILKIESFGFHTVDNWIKCPFSCTGNENIQKIFPLQLDSVCSYGTKLH